MNPARSLARWLLEPEPPGLGLEFRPREMVLARLGGKRGLREMDLCLKAPLPPGVIEFSMLSPNLKERESTARYLRQILDQAGVAGRRIALTLPDTLARISLQDVSEVPRSKAELAEVLRFRLKKTLPFEAEMARLSFQPVRGTPRTFLTGIMHEQVVSQYEELLESLDFQVGSIGISSLSLLNLWSPVVERELEPEADYFFLNIEEDYFTVSLIEKRELPVLVRTVGQRSQRPPGSVVSGWRFGTNDLLRELLPTFIYYREKLQREGLARVYYRSLREDLGDLRDLLESQFEVPVEPFDLKRAVAIGPALTVTEPLASTVGAAAGAALGRAA